MNKLSILLCAVLSSLSLVACGGDGGSSGLPDSKVVGTLTVSEAEALCNELAGVFPERMVTCDGTAITIGIDPADCVGDQPPTTCTATVGDFRDCFEAFGNLSDAQICDDATPTPPACAPVLSAGCTGN